MAPSSLPPPSKRRKTESTTNPGVTGTIAKLEAQLTKAVSSNGSLNALADLLELAQTTHDAAAVSKAIYALYRVFVLVLSEGKLAPGGDEATKIVRAWIQERLNAYVDYLAGLLKDEEKTLRTSALQILFSLQKHLSTSVTTSNTNPQFHVAHFRKIVLALLSCPPSTRPGTTADDDRTLRPDVREQFVETWLSVHDDVRWFFLRDAATALSAPTAPENLLSILTRLDTFPTAQAELNAWWVDELGAKPKPPKTKNGAEDEDTEEPPAAEDGDEDDWRKFFDDEPADKDTKKAGRGARLHQMTLHQSLHALASHRAVFTRCWLALLPRLTSGAHNTATREALAMRALNVLHRGVLPHLTRAVLVMDWVGGCVDYGGAVGLLALNALWVLMRDYNLDYPAFYTRLYAFVDRGVLHVRQRARFFRMAELFLSSTHLPATLLASFVKRLARLSLGAPPAAVVMLVPFTYNVLKQHPALMVMIHRPEVDGAESDPFVPGERDPNATRALESSLWELQSQTRHWHPAAATLARVFEAPFTKPRYALEDFLDHTYGTLFETEVKRKTKKEPAVEEDLRRDLFPADAAEGLVSEVFVL